MNLDFEPKSLNLKTPTNVDQNKEISEKIEKLTCPTCKVETNHKLKWEHTIRSENEQNEMWWQLEYELFQCLGCETPTLRKLDFFSENLGYNSQGDVVIIPELTIWPPEKKFRTIEIKQIPNLPINVRRMYRETIDAYNFGLPTLCAAGIRSVIEAVCKEELIVADDLEKKIEVLKNKGIVTEKISEGLHQNRLIGNEALHEAEMFGDLELKTAIELIETLLDSHYASPNRTNLLKNFLKSKKERLTR